MPQNPAFSPCVAHIDLGCLRRNLRRISPEPQRIMPVIKADAYGHGLLPVARAVSEEGVTHMAVGTVDEAAFLREQGFGQRIVTLLGMHCAADFQRAAAHGITPLVHGPDSLALALHCAPAAGEPPLTVAIKCDTGMGRLGFTAEDLPEALEALRLCPTVQPVLALSHLACADMPEKDSYSQQQHNSFAAMCRGISTVFPQVLQSLCNSAGCLAYPQWGGDVLRPGQALYGANPLHNTEWQHLGAALEPVMSVSTPILQVRELAPGQNVSYGSLFTTTRATRLAVLGVGYADGFARHFTNKGAVVINGHRAPLCGRVCMGMVMADVTHIPAALARAGDDAWIMGGPYPEAVTQHELAALWGTIPYEAQCILGRNTRVYTG